MAVTDIALILWILNLIEMVIVSFIFFQEYRKAGTRFYLGVAIFYVLFVLARLCEIIRLYIIPEGPILPPYTDLGANFWLKTGYTLFSYVGLMIIYFVLERYVFTKTKYIFTILVPITAIISIWFTIDVAHYQLLLNITIPFYLLILFGIVGIYIYLTMTTSGEVRKNSIMIVFGILLFELGLIFALPEVQTSIFAALPAEFLWISAPVLSIIGVILQIRGFKTSIS